MFILKSENIDSCSLISICSPTVHLTKSWVDIRKEGSLRCLCCVLIPACWIVQWTFLYLYSGWVLDTTNQGVVCVLLKLMIDTCSLSYMNFNRVIWILLVIDSWTFRMIKEIMRQAAILQCKNYQSIQLIPAPAIPWIFMKELELQR